MCELVTGCPDTIDPNRGESSREARCYHPERNPTVNVHVIDGYDLDQAMEEAQTQGQAIYDKYK